MPWRKTNNCATQRARKQTQPRVESPKIEFSVYFSSPGKILSKRITTATEASQVCIPYQNMAMIARINAGMLAPNNPKLRRAKTG